MISASVRCLLKFSKDMHMFEDVDSTDEFFQCENGKSLTYRCNQFEGNFIKAV